MKNKFYKTNKIFKLFIINKFIILFNKVKFIWHFNVFIKKNFLTLSSNYEFWFHFSNQQVYNNLTNLLLLQHYFYVCCKLEYIYLLMIYFIKFLSKVF